jgi:NAD dependent epimerase/dehydratase
MPNQYWERKSVLVTGGGGFIASHLVEYLLGAGAHVRAFVRYTSRGEVGFLKEIKEQTRLEIIAGDLRDLDAVDQAIDGVQIVFHLGALVSIPYSYFHPVEVIESNVNGTLNILMACRKHKIEKLIHTSSSEVYGTALSIPINETHTLQGQSPYSASKIGADKLVESFYRTYALPVATVRPFNTYGPRQTARAVIPTIISQALTRDVIRLGNLDTRRDFTYVEDTVRGFSLAAQAEAIDGQVINLGTGIDITIGELANLIIQMIGRPVSVEQDRERLRPEKSEVMRLISDNRQALEKLNWHPIVSLEQGLSKTISWVERHIDLFNPDRYEF